MKKTIYLDTTIPSYLEDERDSIKTFIEITKKWWKVESHKYDIYTSEETIAELSEGNYPKKEKILKFISDIEILSYHKEIENISQIYIDNFVMPKDLRGDAIHLAYSSYYKVDFLLTWNCNHLANANKKQHIRIINTRMNLTTPEIITPMELFEEE